MWRILEKNLEGQAKSIEESLGKDAKGQMYRALNVKRSLWNLEVSKSFDRD
jgi:hypothetical protein